MAENNLDWESILTQLLSDAKQCVNVFKELENKRTWSESISDWVVGDRAKINPERLLKYMKEFAKELEKLLSIYGKLIRKVEWGKKIELLYQEKLESSNIELDFFKNIKIARLLNEFSLSISCVDDSKEQTCKLATTGIVTGGVAMGGAVSGVIAAGAVALHVTGGALTADGVIGTVVTGAAVGILPVIATGAAIPVGLGLLIGAVGAIAYYKIHSSGRGRGLEYQKVKFLYDSFHEEKLLSKLQTLSVKLQQLSDNVDMQLETYKQMIETYQRVITDRNDHKSKATKLYYKTKEAEIEQLISSEPDMDGALRKRMATRTAVSSCKSYLKGSMGYSDSEADKFIEDLES